MNVVYYEHLHIMTIHHGGPGTPNSLACVRTINSVHMSYLCASPANYDCIYTHVFSANLLASLVNCQKNSLYITLLPLTSSVYLKETLTHSTRYLFFSQMECTKSTSRGVYTCLCRDACVHACIYSSAYIPRK